MAIYHLEAKVISRGAGRSACAASAYLSCSQILNDYDGIQHDYTRKSGLVWQQVFLPEFAPQEWSDRAVLWNAVEANEKAKDSRLAREFVVALPIELGNDQWTALLTEYIQTNFVAESMCADVAIHDTDGHNPHAHIMLTVRPLDEQGKWQYKTEKEYLCVRDGEERGFTAAEFKAAQADGWEKQYQYKIGKKKVYMAPSAAEAQGLVRVSKHPKSTKYGRQNPIAEKWNSDEQLVLWRKAWADITNTHLERAGADARIDHRSHAERGLDEQPTIHEGVIARALEKKGIIADRCEINRQIKADNALLRELKATVKKLLQAAKNTLPGMAEKLETLRQNMIIFRYQLLHIATGKSKMNKRLSILRPELERYLRLAKQIKDKTKQRNLLLDERKAVPVWNLAKRQDLAKQIATLAEDIEELRSEKAMLLHSLDCADDAAMGDVKKDIATMESALKMLFHYGHDSLKVPALNFRFLCIEISNTINKIDAEIVDKGNMRPLFEELKDSFGRDPIAMQLFGNDFDSLFFAKNADGEIQRNCSDILKDPCTEASVKRIKRVIDYLLNEMEINDSYYSALKAAITEATKSTPFTIIQQEQLYQLSRIETAENSV